MAPAVETSSSSSFHRSSSTSDLLNLSSFDQPAQHHRRSQSGKNISNLPAFDVPSFNTDFELDTSFFTTDSSQSRPTSPTRPFTSAHAEPVADAPRRRSLARSRTSSIIDRPRSWFPGAKPPKPVVEDEPQRPVTSVGENDTGGWASRLPDLRPLERGLAVSDSFASFAKRSWISTSRSPSPKGRSRSPAGKKVARDDTDDHGSPKKGKPGKQPDLVPSTADQNRPSDAAKPATKAITKASGYLAKMKHKQPMSFAKFNNSADSDNSCASSSASVAPPASNSIDTHTSQTTSCESTHTDESGSEKAPQTRDALWSPFKNLETELKGFLAKQTGPRIIQLQTVILPFLRSTMNHESTKSLRPEDLDRRANIMNKWWMAVLDMLEGQPQQQPVAGVDRPALLEAAAIIMVRPEWRQMTPSFQPLADRSSAQRRARSWTNSSASTANSTQAAFLAESAEHNVRTMFVSNLVKQMGIVVDKMSLRHAPLSLVNFAGKTCAYAFFFAPGVADILVRLWALNPDLLRRTADEFGLPRKSKSNDETRAISAPFPPHLSAFGWTSPKAAWDMLKETHQMPMLVARIPWTGPWVVRWKGRDTDLFFIFCKYFHILSNQFMLSGLPLKDKARSPGFVLVHTQLLGLLDTTIHRQAAAAQAHGQPPLIDSMHGSDASAMALPLPPSNLAKGISENRMVILLKDMLSDDSIGIAGAKHTFAEVFAALLKAATRKTSQFNSAACFTLCDFLEEVLTTYSVFETPGGTAAYVDWTFWVDVWKKILGSLNTMSEIRILSFIFAAWDVLAKDPQRKAVLCLDWLLKEDVFDTFFNHWCPMVRAYYHRLLCWRICRDEGSANEVDASIFIAAASRLKTAWAHYLYLKQTAEESGKFPPSTAPMLPTPGKKFMIIRQEVNIPQPGLFMGFDSFAKIPSADPLSANVLTESDILSKVDSKKRWSLLGKVLSLTSTNASQAAPTSGHGRSNSWSDELQTARRETAESRTTRTGAPPPPPKVLTSGGKDMDSGCSSPVFEEPKHVFRFFLGWQQAAVPPRERVLTRPRLPAPAQSRVSIRARSGTPPPPPPGMPATTRMISGSPPIGLIYGAKNAISSDPTEETTAYRPSISFSRLEGGYFDTSTFSGDDDTLSRPCSGGQTPTLATAEERLVEPITQPVKPTGMYAKNAVYAGRALAEWGLVVFECNAFIDRRREEGVLGLSELEVPVLGVEGFRKLGG